MKILRIAAMIGIPALGLCVLLLFAKPTVVSAAHSAQESSRITAIQPRSIFTNTALISATQKLTDTDYILIPVSEGNRLVASGLMTTTDLIPVVDGAKFIGFVLSSHARATAIKCATATTNLYPSPMRVGETIFLEAISSWQASTPNCLFEMYAFVNPVSKVQISDFVVWFDRSACTEPLPRDSWWCTVVISDTQSHSIAWVYVDGLAEGTFTFMFDSPSAGIAGEDENAHVDITIKGRVPIFGSLFLPLVTKAIAVISVTGSEVITK